MRANSLCLTAVKCTRYKKHWNARSAFLLDLLACSSVRARLDTTRGEAFHIDRGRENITMVQDCHRRVEVPHGRAIAPNEPDVMPTLLPQSPQPHSRRFYSTSTPLLTCSSAPAPPLVYAHNRIPLFARCNALEITQLGRQFPIAVEMSKCEGKSSEDAGRALQGGGGWRTDEERGRAGCAAYLHAMA